MCDTCGCGQEGEKVIIRKVGSEAAETSNSHQSHSHEHAHSHDKHHHHHHPGREIIIEQDVLQKNKLLAERNRGYFEAKKLIALNLVSSPGSGKTSLLEKTIRELKDREMFYVIEGDQQSMNDAERISRTGSQVVQINTGQGCHLDSSMVREALNQLDIDQEGGFLMIENVGNLVCPALFDLGESKRVVVMSVTEGEDKPVKYPAMFQSADLCIINKTDLLPYLDFDITQAIDYARQVNPKLEFIELSVRSGENMEKWYSWLEALKVEELKS